MEDKAGFVTTDSGGNKYCPMKYAARNLIGMECGGANCAWWITFQDISGHEHNRCAIVHFADPNPIKVNLNYPYDDEGKPI